MVYIEHELAGEEPLSLNCTLIAWNISITSVTEHSLILPNFYPNPCGLSCVLYSQHFRGRLLTPVDHPSYNCLGFVIAWNRDEYLVSFKIGTAWAFYLSNSHGWTQICQAWPLGYQVSCPYFLFPGTWFLWEKQAEETSNVHFLNMFWSSDAPYECKGEVNLEHSKKPLSTHRKWSDMASLRPCHYCKCGVF